MPIDLSIIIVSWNTRELLAQCLESIYANPPCGEFEVFVVDNASGDGSASMVRERFTGVRLIENRENAGFARANNQGIRESTGSYVMLLNSDTIVQPGALQKMVSFLDTHAEAGCIGAHLLNEDGTAQWCYGRFPTILSETVFAWGLNSRWPFSRRYPLRNGSEGKCVETGWVLGASMMIRREALEQAELMDENYFMYSEEVDLAYRVSREGWKNYVLRDAPIVHLGGSSTRKIPAAMKAELFRSKHKYFRKHHGPVAAVTVNLSFASSILARRLVYRLLGKKSLYQLWSETWQYYAGEKHLPAAGYLPAKGRSAS